MSKALNLVALACCIGLVACATGCSANTVYDSDRQLQEQNSEAAVVVTSNGAVMQQGLDAAAGALATPPTVQPVDALSKLAAASAALQLQQQAAADIKANSDQELKNWGNPKTSQPYSPANSGSSRGTSDQQHTNPWYVQLGNTVLTILGTAATIYFGANGIPALGALFNKPAMKALGTVFTSVSNIKQKTDANPTDTIHLSDIEAELSTLAQAPEMQPYLNGFTKALHLGSLLPQTPPGTSTIVASPAPAPAPAPAAAATTAPASTK
ncbi:MAG TPA: hypothetical protein VG457_13000 [Planctomycetota bacterium]|nr:hypothetical protein [Planctomycetota bacterium]